MTTSIHRGVEAAQKGENPAVICKVTSGWVMMSDPQVLPGYCLLLPDPVPPNLNAMEMEQRLAFLKEMSLVGDALLEVTGAVRINYEILGNLDPALHAHVIPRYAHEPDGLRTRPIWFYDLDSAPRFDPERDRELMDKIRAAVGRRL